MRAECNSIIVSFHELAKIAFSLCDAKNSTDGIFRSALKLLGMAMLADLLSGDLAWFGHGQ